MREVTIIHKNTCDRCRTEISGEPLSLYKRSYGPEVYDAGYEIFVELCDPCWDKVMDFIRKESE